MPPSRLHLPRLSRFGALIVLAAALALALRLPHLTAKPLHTDESVQAFKTGMLLDTGVYHYDPQEFHGPSLYFLTVPLVWLSGARSFAESTIVSYRLVPLIFGVGLVLLLGLLGDGLGRRAAVIAAVLTAVSPAMVYYSRYYIQEMLFIFFTFAALVAAWRYGRAKSARWAALLGVCLGLMHATKETCVIAYAAFAAAFAMTLLWRHWHEGIAYPFALPVRLWHLALIFVVGGLSANLLFTSFFRQPSGFFDSFRTFVPYLYRAGGAGLHDHPWWYYLKMLLYTHDGPGPRWSEAPIMALAAVGIGFAMTRRGIPGANLALIRFLAFYTVLTTVAYCAIPYKTPWNMLSLLHGMILMAGVGAAGLIGLASSASLKAVAVALLVVAAASLAWQAWRGANRFAFDPRNPYVYAHTVSDTVRLGERVLDLSRLDPEGRRMLVQVFVPGADYWPLPWYLRRLGRVGYWSELSADPIAPVIIAAPELQPKLESRLRGPYHCELYGLRPGVLLALYVRDDLWNRFLSRRVLARPAPSASLSPAH